MIASLKSDSDALAATRRIVGNSIASSMLIGTPSQKAAAWTLAAALDQNGVEVEGPVREALQRQGADYDEVWVRPVRPFPFGSDAPQKVGAGRPSDLIRVVVDQLIGMSTSWGPDLRERAHEFIRELDEAGIEIDRLIDDRSRETGHGPYLCDMFGHRYDLNRQWFDSRGKRWEYTRSWSDVGGPVMRRDEPDGDSMVLSDLIRERGPLYPATPAPKAPEQPADEPPF